VHNIASVRIQVAITDSEILIKTTTRSRLIDFKGLAWAMNRCYYL